MGKKLKEKENNENKENNVNNENSENKENNENKTEQGEVKQKKKMKLWKKILIGIGIFFGLIILLIGVIAVRHWRDIKALYIAMTTDTAVLDEKIKEKDKEFASAVKDYLDASIRDFNEEEIKQIEEGKKTEVQVLAEIIDEKYEEDKNAQQEKPQKETAGQIVSRHVSNLYAHQSEFEGRVSALAANVKAYTHSYKATHPNGSWRDAKIAAVNRYMATANSIESDCYARVDKEIAALRSELKAINADLSIVDTVRSSAEQTMELKKSRIMSQYMDKMG